MSLNGYESSQFHMCEDFVILEKEIVCNCFNSAVLYEDIGNIFVAKKEEFVDNSDSVESEYTLKSLIIVLSVFIFILLCLHWG